jgi:DNA recombination protein RmuC
MDVVVLVVAIIILLIAVVLFLKRPKSADGVSVADIDRLKAENTALNINLAKAEERALGLGFERDKADKQLQDERVRYETQITTLNQELLAEKNRMANVLPTMKNQSTRYSKNFS